LHDDHNGALGSSISAVFDTNGVIVAFFDRQKWISTQRAAIMNFDHIRRIALVFDAREGFSTHAY
jgi:hypothetical protein